MKKSKIWLWGQTAGSHHAAGNNQYGLPGVNRMTPLEGAKHFGIENVCRVKMSIDTGVKFKQELEELKEMNKLVLSIVGAGGCPFNKEGKDDLQEIMEVAKDNPKVIAGIMDDFVNPDRMETYTPEVLRVMRERMHTEIGRKVEFWTVIYERDLLESEEDVNKRLQEFDLCTFWTWFGDNLLNLEENFAKIKEKAGKTRLMLGVYMWDYGNKRPLSDELMRHQLAFVEEKYEKGEIEGIVLCSNCIADIGLSTEKITREWINSLD